MDHDTSQSKQKRKKTVLSGSEEEELVKKHKIGSSEEESQKEEAEGTQVPKDGIIESAELIEGKQNGKYKDLPARGLSDSDSAGTDVELTSDEETPQNYQKSRKKRKINTKNERKSVDDLAGSSSESEDDRSNSPKSPSSVKKFYRKRRTNSGTKSQLKMSTDSESCKTDSDSDNEPLKQNPRKGPSSSHSAKKKSHESPRTLEKSEVKALQKNEVETEGSTSEDTSNFQRKTKHSSSDESRQTIKKEQNLSDDDKSNDAIKSAKKFVSKNSGSSSDEWIDPARRQRERELRRQKKRGSCVKQNATSTKAKTLHKSSDKVTLNSDSEKSSDNFDSSAIIKEKMEEALDSEALQKEKGVRKEEPSSDSDSEASDKQVSVKETLKKKNSETKRSSNSPTSSSSEQSDKQVSVKDTPKKKNSETKRRSNSPTSSSSEGSDKQVSVKDSLKKGNSETKRRSNSPASSSSHKKQRDDSSGSSENEKSKTGKRQKNKLPDEDKRIISLKKYLKTAGIRVHNYAELWKDCRSNKARAQKMLSLLEQNGLKGRPTIEKCKKLRKKIETRKEVEELDLSNVMDCGEGRTRRSRLKTSGLQELSDHAEQKASEIKGRLRLLADSDSD